MDVKTLEQLTAPDDRTLAFTSLGLGGALSPSAAAEFQQRLIAGCDLVPEVPDETRRSFERLRTLHSYGVLCYDMFTVAENLAWLVLEQALRDRFIAFYDGRSIPLTNAKTGEACPLPASAYSEVDAAFRARGSHHKGGWLLELSTGQEMPFRGNMSQLLTWGERRGF